MSALIRTVLFWPWVVTIAIMILINLVIVGLVILVVFRMIKKDRESKAIPDALPEEGPVEESNS